MVTPLVLSVAVSGAGGKLASPIIRAIAAADDLELTSLYNPNRDGQEIEGVSISGDPGAVKAGVLVETAHADVVFENLEMWRGNGSAVVVGTSGFTPDRLERLESMWGTDSPCLVVPNFSIGATLMMRFAAEAASHFDSVEIVERHSSSKPDAPSGTSLASAMGVARAGGTSSARSQEMVEGARGAEVEGVRIHSVRLPGLIAQQEVALSNPGEVLSIEHMSTSHESFAMGALIAIRKVGSLSGGVHLGLDEVL